uniref:Chromosome 12 open reading frame 50 n=1 Tax=Spermophilus dauricus TaxID=99837 RepID=A0A8C9QCM5_SPEDA
MEMQQNCSISCFWETQPLGCVKISCIFYHSKPRNINGLFLPPSSNTTLQKESQEGIQPVNHSQEPLKPQDNITRPIHHPLVLKTNFEDEEEEGEEQNDASSLWTKTPEEIEEKRAIKEMCYKSGEYYRFHTPPDISSSTSIAPTVEKELEKPLENGSGMQEGDGLTVPTKFSLFERQGEIKTSLDRKPRTDIATLENGGGDCYVPQRIIFLGVDESEALSEEKEITTPKCSNNKVNDVQPVRKPHFKGVKKRKWIYDEPKNFPGSGMRRAVQVPNPKNKMSYHHNNKNRNAENSAYIHVQRNAVRTVPLNAPPRSRPPNGSYHKADVNKEPKLNLCSDKYMSTSYKGSAWRKRIPFSKPYSKTEKIYPEPRRNGSK